jgi:hypothetical protein
MDAYTLVATDIHSTFKTNETEIRKKVAKRILGRLSSPS